MRSNRCWWVLFVFALRCGGEHSPSLDATADTATDATDAAISSSDGPAPLATFGLGMVRGRPYRWRIPRNYDASRAWPLVLLLHGYGAGGVGQDSYFQLSSRVDAQGFLYAYPDGTRDAMGRLFWNATDGCCNFSGAPVDDVAFLTGLIDDMAARYRLDARRVYLFGHSNGAFMAHRMACERSERIAGIAALAGASWLDRSRCAPREPVAILDVHGTDDDVIAFNGGVTPVGGAMFPSEIETIAGWAERNRCDPMRTLTGRTLDLEMTLAGAETVVSAHANCAPGGAAELWTMQGGGHVPNLTERFSLELLQWLFAQEKPAR